MQSNRRAFLAGGVASFCAAGPSERSRAAAIATAPRDDDIHCLDYGLSFICNPSSMNAVRFWIESRTTVIDDSTGRATEYYQCGSCKSEHTFAKKNLLHEDNYDFLPIFGDDDLLIFRRLARLSNRYRELRKSKDVWGRPILKLRVATSRCSTRGRRFATPPRRACRS